MDENEKQGQEQQKTKSDKLQKSTDLLTHMCRDKRDATASKKKLEI